MLQQKEAQDALGLGEKIIYLLKNKNIAREMGKQGRQIIGERFSFKARLKKIEGLYVELMEERGRYKCRN